MRLQLGKGLLDWIEVGTVGRQEQQLGAGRLDGLAHRMALVARQVVDDWFAPRLAETSFKADMIRRRAMMTTETAASGGVGLGRGGRMSRQRKRDAVLRLLRGEDLEILSRALGVTAATLTGWRDTFVAAGEASLATRSTDGEALETER